MSALDAVVVGADPCSAVHPLGIGSPVFVPHGWNDDLTDAVERHLERFAPGFRDVVRARHVSCPADLEAGNANYVGGDIACGSAAGLRLVARPRSSWTPYATPDPAVYLCSSATPPGPGVHGMCGYHAARAAPRQRFGIRLPVIPPPARS